MLPVLSFFTAQVLHCKTVYGHFRMHFCLTTYSFLGEEFSERFFFYSLMKRCFGLNYVNYSGEELEKAIGKGMPDYYLRYRNRVFVFGCKDVQMAAKMKLSGDYETIKNIF